MNKRISRAMAFLLTAAVMLCLAGCGDSSAYKLVTDATQKTASLDSYAAKMTMNIEMLLGEETVKVPPIVYDITASGIKTDSPKQRIKTTSTSEAGESHMDMYIEGENYYISAMGEKYQVPAEKMPENGKTENTLDKIMADMPEELFEGVEVTEKADGVKEISIIPSKEAFNEIYSELVEMMKTQLGATGSSVELSDVAIKIAVDKNGYISSETVSFTMNVSMTAAGVKMDVVAKSGIKVEYIEPGSKVTVQPIEGYKDFEVLEQVKYEF